MGRLLEAWPPEASAVIPGSGGPLGMEPLCAGYRTRALPKIGQVLESSGRSMEDALRVLEVCYVPPRVLGSAEELSRAFTNVNTRADAEAARSPHRAGIPHGHSRELGEEEDV